MDGEKITQQEMFEMFGEEMPIEAATLLFDTDESKTIGEVRDELREIAKRKKDAATDLVERLPVVAWAYQSEVETALRCKRSAITPSNYIEHALARQSDAQALIETLTRERDEAFAALDLEPDGPAWRFWSRKAQDVVQELQAMTARAEAAEREVESLRKALDAIFRLVTYPVDTSISPLGYGLRSIDISGCEYIAEKVMSVPEAGE